MQSIQKQIVARVYGKGRGWAFSPKDFRDLANRPSIDQALSVLRRKGTIRRVARGLYDYPRVSKALNLQSPPDIDQTAHALARSRGWQIQATGVWAVNLLGLSTQVPARVVYLTNGKGKKLTIGNTAVEFRPVSPKDLEPGICGLVIQALKAIGKDNIGDDTIRHLRGLLPGTDCRQLLRKKHVTGWLFEVIRRICGEEE